MDRKTIGREVLDNMHLTKEQYEQFCSLADELGLDIPDPVEPQEWDDILWDLEQMIPAKLKVTDNGKDI